VDDMMLNNRYFKVHTLEKFHSKTVHVNIQQRRFHKLGFYGAKSPNRWQKPLILLVHK